MNDRFTGIDNRLDSVKELPQNVTSLTSEVKELRADVGEAKDAAKAVQRVLLGFFSALLIVLIAAIVGVVVAL